MCFHPEEKEPSPKLPVRCLQGSGWEKEVRVGVKALREVTESPCRAGQWLRRKAACPHGRSAVSGRWLCVVARGGRLRRVFASLCASPASVPPHRC